MEKLVLENEYENVVPLFGARFAAPNKGTTVLYWFRSLSTVLSSTENRRIQGLFKAFEWFPSTFQSRTFQESPLNSSTFQPLRTLIMLYLGSRGMDHVIFVCVDALYPSQHFSAMSGRFPVFLGWTTSKQWIKCLAQGYNTVTGEYQTSNPLIPNLIFYQLSHCIPLSILTSTW